MGDRCYVSMRIHKEDMEREEWKQWIADHGGDEYGNDADGDWAQGDCNYGLTDQREELAHSGIRFHGTHSSGCDYPGFMYYSDGRGVHEWPVDEMYDPSLRLSAACNVRVSHFQALKVFLRNFNKWRKRIEKSHREE